MDKHLGCLANKILEMILKMKQRIKNLQKMHKALQSRNDIDYTCQEKVEEELQALEIALMPNTRTRRQQKKEQRGTSHSGQKQHK